MTSRALALRSDSRHDADFAAMLAEQMRRAPWLAISATGHLLLVLLLWLLMPASARLHEELRVAFAAAPDALVLPPPQPPTIEPKDEPPVDTEPQLVPQDDVATPLDTTVVDAGPPGVDSAFDAPFLNTTLGLSGSAGPRGHGSNRGDMSRRRESAQPQIQAALRWLVAHQDEDGHWDCDGFMKHDHQGPPCDGAGSAVHDIGVTGLALLAFLGDGSTLRQGEYREPLRKGVQWLRSQQQDNGLFGGAAASDFVYDHAIATYAMCEACGLSDYRVLRAPTERGLAYLAQHRNPYGAWRYQPRDGDADTSVTGWCVMALASAKSLGFAVDDAALRDALTFFDACTDADGRTGYRRQGEGSARRPGDHAQRFPRERGEPLTAVALFCRFFLGQEPSAEPRMQLAQRVIAQKPPSWDSGSVDPYYWYYGTYAMYQAGGPQWPQWSRQLRAALVPHQRTDGNFGGSWDPVGVWGEDGGRVTSTALLALCLQASYRYTRLVR